MFLAAAASPPAAAVQVTHQYTDDASPAPDGRRMVSIRTVDGREQLFVMHLDGGAPHQITHDAADHEDPAWSPDGTRIAYVAKAGGGEVITVIKADGSAPRPVSPPGQKAIHPAWSRDSRRLIWCTDDDLAPPRKNDSDLVVADLATGRTTVLVIGGVNTYPSWSPDGRMIAFRRMLADNSEVFTARADGTGARNLTGNPAFDGWPAWSPDGRRIAFASNRGGAAYRVYVMKPDGSDVRLAAETDGRGTAPKWTVDGKAILFTICKRAGAGFDCEIWRAPAPKR